MKINLLNLPYLTRSMVFGLLIQLLFSSSVYANDNKLKSGSEQQTIRGTVTSSEDNLGIPGVNILVKEIPNRGAVTDMEGNYTIDAPADATLVFSFIGYKTIERKRFEVYFFSRWI